MTWDAWSTLIAAVGTIVAGGLGTWMTLMHRGLLRIEHLAVEVKSLAISQSDDRRATEQAIADLRTEKERAHETIWRRLESATAEVSAHGERLATLEARKAHA